MGSKYSVFLQILQVVGVTFLSKTRATLRYKRMVTV